MEKLKQISVIFLFLFALLLMWRGWKCIFKTEKVYIGYNDYIHTTPYCPYLNDETNVDLIKETGELMGCEEMSREEALNDLAFEMCTYCFSAYHIKERYEYFKNGYKECYEEKKDEAIRKRKEKKQKELDEWYEKYIHK